MAENQPNRATDAYAEQAFPGRTIGLEPSAAQVAYIRTLLYEDLKEWAETLAGNAQDAYETANTADAEDPGDPWRHG